MFPLWLANYALEKMRNPTAEIMDFEEFIMATMNEASKPKTKKKKMRTAEEILNEFMTIAEADMQKEG